MATIYLVTSGSYSDYHVDAVFSTRELAEAFHAKHSKAHGDTNDIEEMPLDDPERVAAQIRSYWHVWLDVENGICNDYGKRFKIGTEAITERHEWTTMSRRSEMTWEEGRSVDTIGPGGRFYRPTIAYITSYVSAEHCHKLAVEAIQAWRAKQAVQGR